MTRHSKVALRAFEIVRTEPRPDPSTLVVDTTLPVPQASAEPMPSGDEGIGPAGIAVLVAVAALLALVAAFVVSHRRRIEEDRRRDRAHPRRGAPPTPRRA